MKRLGFGALLSFLLVGSLAAQNGSKRVDLKEITDGQFRQVTNIGEMRSMPDGEHYTAMNDARNMIIKYSYRTGNPVDTLFNTEKARECTFDKFDGYTISSTGHHILVWRDTEPIYRRSFKANVYDYDVRRNYVKPISDSKGKQMIPTFSPDGRMVAYVSDNNIWIRKFDYDTEVQVTKDGEMNKILNGITDWVYEEEFAVTNLMAWSPNSEQLAFVRFDESEVPLMEMMRFDGKLYNEAYSFKYPKAGEKNSTLQLWVADLETGAKSRIDTGSETDQYIPRLGFTPDGRLWYYRLNRRQNTFEMVLCEPHGAQRVIYEERAQQYVERVDDGTVTFVDNDRFLVRQESHTGYMHLYLYSIRRGLLAQVTKGAWEVTGVVGTDGKRVWYLSTETSPLRRNLYSVRLDGKDKRRLTPGEGYYSIAPSRGMKYYISTFSNAATPNRVEICDGEGNVVRTLADSRALREELAARRVPVKEFFTFTTERGDTLNAYMIRPRDFDPSKRYPVLLTQYSGPGSQQVADRWSVDWEDALVEKGYVVVSADGRGTGFRGEKFKKQTYGRLGALEVEDQLSTARYMAAQPWVDADRIGIYGWSYGGFMAVSCALKGHGLFRMAIAVAPVTSWRYYDTIYTEIYNNLPQYNAAGYDDNSPINFARMLDDEKTRLLIIHGTADDNVHFQNTVELTRALNRYGKQYDMMVYPDQNHSMQPSDTYNVRQKMIDYTLEHL